MDNIDLCNVFLAIATNIPVRLKTAFVVQGHIYFLNESAFFYSFPTILRPVAGIKFEMSSFCA